MVSASSDGKPAAALANDGASASSTTDEVDSLLAAWQRERPDLDTAPLAVLSRVTRLARLLDLERRASFTDHDLDVGEFDVLTALRRAGAPYQLSAGSLGASTMVTSGTMTHRIDRLAVRGLVTRLRDPNDGRAVIVQLTDLGKRRVDEALTSLLRAEQGLLAHLSADDRDELARLLRALLLPLEGELPS